MSLHEGCPSLLVEVLLGPLFEVVSQTWALWTRERVSLLTLITLRWSLISRQFSIDQLSVAIHGLKSITCRQLHVSMVSSRPTVGSYPWSQVDHLSAAACIHGLKSTTYRQLHVSMVSSRPPVGSYPWSQVDHLSAATCIHGLKSTTCR